MEPRRRSTNRICKRIPGGCPAAESIDHIPRETRTVSSKNRVWAELQYRLHVRESSPPILLGPVTGGAKATVYYSMAYSFAVIFFHCCTCLNCVDPTSSLGLKFERFQSPTTFVTACFLISPFFNEKLGVFSVKHTLSCVLIYIEVVYVFFSPAHQRYHKK